jgi:RimJ/RimL family protein N-acetyltransferase
MKFIGFEREEEAERWVRERLQLPAAPSFFRAMAAVDAAGQFVCAVVMTNFTARNVDLNVAVEATKLRPRAAAEMFNRVFGYLFNTLHITRVTALLRGKNHRAARFVKQLGFTLEGVMRKAFADDDLHVYGFLADDYKTHAWRRG